MAQVISGQTIVTTAGAAVALGTLALKGAMAVKGLNANAGLIFIGNDGEGDVDDGHFELAPGELIVFDKIDHQGQVMVDCESDGDGVCWIILTV